MSLNSSFSGKSWLPEIMQREYFSGWSKEKRRGEKRRGQGFLPLGGHWTGRSPADAGPASEACWDLALQTDGSNTPAGDGAVTTPTRQKKKEHRYQHFRGHYAVSAEGNKEQKSTLPLIRRCSQRLNDLLLLCVLHSSQQSQWCMRRCGDILDNVIYGCS